MGGVAKNDESDSDFECSYFTSEEAIVLKSHGFEVCDQFHATRTLIFSEQEIHVFKIQNASTYFEMRVRTGSDCERVKAKLATLDAVIFYLEAFEKSNLFAEMMG